MDNSFIALHQEIFVVFTPRNDCFVKFGDSCSELDRNFRCYKENKLEEQGKRLFAVYESNNQQPKTSKFNREKKTVYVYFAQQMPKETVFEALMIKTSLWVCLHSWNFMESINPNPVYILTNSVQ